jgi:hypothetical protein
MIPPQAPAVILALQGLLPTYWPDMPAPSFLPAQIEQETCPSPRHRMCFSERAELRTSREYGFGLGQLTITRRFNAFEEVKRLHPDLADWRFEDRYDRRRQLVALIVKDRHHHRSCARLMATPADALACVAAQYNGGAGGFLADQRVCANTQGCDPRRWFGHVEHTSTKAKRPLSGYGQSFFQINREYVRNVMQVRRMKYRELMGDAW